MTDKQMKWLILFTPTVTIGLWEYARHTLLLPYLSMGIGNLLSPIIVFVVTIIFLTRLFTRLEINQEELKEERVKKASLEEREKMARELHDGIAQSLFLLGVKMNKIGKQTNMEQNNDYKNMKKTLKHLHDDVRQAISNLRKEPSISSRPWMETFYHDVKAWEQDHQLKVNTTWSLPDHRLTTKEKVELLACVKEAVMNVIKHAKTNTVWIEAKETENGWFCKVSDVGIGIDHMRTDKEQGYGLQIIKDRADDMGWSYSFTRVGERTILMINKENE